MPKVKRKTGTAAIPPDQFERHPDQNVPHPPPRGEPPLTGTTDPSEKFIIGKNPIYGMHEVRTAEDFIYVTLPEGVQPQAEKSWIDAGDGEHFHLLECTFIYWSAFDRQGKHLHPDVSTAVWLLSPTTASRL